MKPCQEYHREFQALGSMQRQQPYRAGRISLACGPAQIRFTAQGYCFQKFRHGIVERSGVCQSFQSAAALLLLGPAAEKAAGLFLLYTGQILSLIHICLFC